MATPESYKRELRDELRTQDLSTNELAAAVARTVIPPSLADSPDLEAGFRMGLEEALRTSVPGEELEVPGDRMPARQAYMAEFMARVTAKVIGAED